MVNHSRTLAWKMPWTEGPGRLQSMGSQRVWHDWACTHTHAHIYPATSLRRGLTSSASAVVQGSAEILSKYPWGTHLEKDINDMVLGGSNRIKLLNKRLRKMSPSSLIFWITCKQDILPTTLNTPENNSTDSKYILLTGFNELPVLPPLVVRYMCCAC